MPELEELLDWLARWSGPPQVAAPDRCLNRRFPAVACRICVDACPAAALHPADPVELDPLACLGCGLCLHRCPTEVFAQLAPPEEALWAHLDAFPEGPWDLVCAAGGDPAVSRAPDARLRIRWPRCLAALSPALLTRMALERGEVWLDDGACADCPLGPVHAEMVETVRRANQALAMVGHPPRVHLYSQAEERLSPPRSLPWIRGEEVPIDRRTFFRSLGGLLRQAVTGGEPRGPLPRERVRWLAVLGDRAPDPAVTPNLPWGWVEVDGEACTACGRCSDRCPTEALRLEGDEAHWVLQFRPRACIACRICVLVCPEDAVTLTEAPASRLLDPFPQPRAAGEWAACSGCGRPVARREGEDRPLCYTCRAVDPERIRALLSGDLLQRIAERPSDPQGEEG